MFQDRVDPLGFFISHLAAPAIAAASAGGFVVGLRLCGGNITFACCSLSGIAHPHRFFVYSSCGCRQITFSSTIVSYSAA